MIHRHSWCESQWWVWQTFEYSAVYYIWVWTRHCYGWVCQTLCTIFFRAKVQASRLFHQESCVIDDSLNFWCQHWIVSIRVDSTICCFLLRDWLTRHPNLYCRFAKLLYNIKLTTAAVKVENKSCINTDQLDQHINLLLSGPWLWCLTTRTDLCFSTLQVKPKTSVDFGEVVEDQFLLTSTQRKPLNWTPLGRLSSPPPLVLDGWMKGEMDDFS